MVNRHSTPRFSHRWPALGKHLAPGKHLVIGLMLVLLSGVAVAAASSELSAIVDRSTIGLDETLQLTVRYSGSRQQGQPNFDELNTQFDILSSSQSNQFRSVNGQVTSYTDWVMLLAPKREGTLFIPSFRYAGAISDAIEITVTAANQTPRGTLKDVFVETIVDKSSVFVQEQFIIKYRLYYSVNVDSLDAEPLELENAVKESLPDVRFSRRINDQLYRIAEFSYAVYPQTSGTLEIPVLIWDVKIPKAGSRQSFMGLSGRYEVSRLRTDAATVEVKPRPASYPADAPWLPAQTIEISENWSKAPEDFNVGEPITRTITLKAEGLMAAQLPKIWGDRAVDGVKSYADQPELNDEKSENGLVGVRRESAAVVASQAGEATLPAIRIPWWNTTTDALEYAEIPARTIRTVASSSAEDSGTGAIEKEATETGTSAPPHANDAALQNLGRVAMFWRTVSGILFLVALVAFTAAGYFALRSRSSLAAHDRRRSEDPAMGHALAEKNAYRAFQRACANKDALSARKNLITWAQYRWGPQVLTLDDVAAQLQSPEATPVLRQLDAALYSKHEGAFDGEALARLIKAAKDSARSQQNRDTTLEGFYAT